jgi:putative addiction module component (TIGR02574 family)
MMATLESVRRDAMSLPQDERELLALDLALSIEKEPGYDEAWAAELERRWQQMKDGTAELLDDDEADALLFGNDSDR